MNISSYLLLSFFAFHYAHAAYSLHRCRWYPFPMTREFCAKPPVVSALDLRSYGGTWFQAYANAAALRVSSSDCVTANYSLRADGKSVDVLNCQHNSSNSQGKPICVSGMASMRPLIPADPAYLQVKFGPDFPPGAYNVAAVLGSKEYGYYAAAVYSCRFFRGKAVEGWFILIRNPYEAERALYKLQSKLACVGYNIYASKLFPTTQGKGCKYFNGPEGFDVIPPGPPSSRRPPA